MYAVSLPLRQTLNDMNMEIVSIEKKTFEMMVAAFGALSEKVAALRGKSDTRRMAYSARSSLLKSGTILIRNYLTASTMTTHRNVSSHIKFLDIDRKSVV